MYLNAIRMSYYDKSKVCPQYSWHISKYLYVLETSLKRNSCLLSGFMDVYNALFMYPFVPQKRVINVLFVKAVITTTYNVSKKDVFYL